MHSLRNTPEADLATTPENASAGLEPFDPLSDLRFQIGRRFSSYNEAMMTDPRSPIETLARGLSRVFGLAAPVAAVGLFLVMAGSGF